MIKKITACLGMLMCMVCLISAAQPIPQDPSIRKGKLANGFTYYIKANKIPEKSVQLQLVNNVGSILEDEKERGYAHFIEHMSFNGTKHFPGNEMVDFLEKAGVKFGADLNAYTTFDETVYELPLTLNNSGILVKGLRIMRDWAQEASLDANEIEKEKGVILEEKRLKSGMQDRMSTQYMPMVFNHSRYANRNPIGLEEVINSASSETLKQFYKNWYRPDLQALIVVGDIDVNFVENQVKMLFGSLKKPLNAKSRIVYTVPLALKDQYTKVTDAEMSVSTIQLMRKQVSKPVATIADYKSDVISTIFRQMLASRINERKYSQQDPAFKSFTVSVQPFVSGLNMFSFEVSATDGKLKTAFEQGWAILLQLKAHGFTASELERAKKQYLSALGNSVKNKEHRSSKDFISGLKDNYLKNSVLPSIEWEQQLVTGFVPLLKLSDINPMISDLIRDNNLDMLVIGPQSQKDLLPDEATLRDWMNTLSAKQYVPYREDSLRGVLMPILPVAGKVTAKEQLDQTGLTKITLSNGIKVVLKPTNFKKEEILFNGFGQGGTFSFSKDRFYDASLVSSISGFGLAGFSPVELSRMLNGKTLSISPYFSNRSHGISGMSSTTDIETALQMLYLQFTQPRGDSVRFNLLKDRIKEGVSKRYLNPETIFSDTINHVLNNYDSRFLPPDSSRISSVTLDNVLKIYRGYFEDASKFTFVFTGDFETEKMIPLLERYLGALPSKHPSTILEEVNIKIPAGQITKKVYAGTENKSTVKITLSGDFKYTPLNNLLLTALGDILEIKLIQTLREKASEVYNPSVKASCTKVPGSYNISISFGCAPSNVDNLYEMVSVELQKLRNEGPQAEDILKFKANQLKNIRLSIKENGFWLSYLSNQMENQEDLSQVDTFEKYLDQVTAVSLKTAAENYLKEENKITFILLPQRSK
ncbi:M16 family metallopeptidase [Pedobacter sp.]|jgi:zinc protease|uniref:M16 family metallopeptidase n=1 Tax=Pedobacter sp. TaxID=1411316 RepID=UPI002BBFC1DE|nr:insulinase family protein [Pedobacter sp.]HWW40176.1 insulinase family protein [Pedobacter sp.]